MLVVHQQVTLSREAREALEHGVPLVIRIDGLLKPPRGAQTGTVHLQRCFVIRHLPLSGHYQLAGGDDDRPPRTYPRLRHALAGLAEIELILPPGPASRGAWEAQARTRLVKRELPAPMRLPAWFSPRWRHDSGWLTQSVSLPERT